MTNDELQKLATKAMGDDDMPEDEQVALMEETAKDLEQLADELPTVPSSDDAHDEGVSTL